MVPCLAHIKDAVPKHIPHPYSKEIKKLINPLGVQKTLTVVNCANDASHGIDEIVGNLEKQTNIHRQSSKHTVASADDDAKTMIKVLRKLQLFKSVPNSKHSNFHNISKSPFDELDVMLLKTWLKKHKTSLSPAQSYCPAKDNLWTTSIWCKCIGPKCSTVFH